MLMTDDNILWLTLFLTSNFAKIFAYICSTAGRLQLLLLRGIILIRFFHWTLVANFRMNGMNQLIFILHWFWLLSDLYYLISKCHRLLQWLLSGHNPFAKPNWNRFWIFRFLSLHSSNLNRFGWNLANRFQAVLLRETKMVDGNVYICSFEFF